MAVLPTLYPNAGLANSGSWSDEAGGVTNLYLVIDETGAAGTDYIRTGTSGGPYDYTMGVTDMPSDFLTMNSLQIEIRHSRGGVEAGDDGGGDDTWSLFAYITDAAGTTALAGANSTPANGQAIHSASAGWLARTDTVAFTYVNTTADKTAWDGARLTVEAVFNQTKGNDGDRVWVDYVRLVNGDYDASVAGTTVEPGAISRSFTVPGPAVKGAATIAPSATARSFGVNAVTVAGLGEVAPSAIARSFGVNAVTIHGAAVAAVSTTARSFAIPAVTIDNGAADATVTPDPIALAVSIAASTQVGSAVVVIGPHTYAVVMPQASPKAPGAVAPEATTTSITVPALTVEGGSVVETGMSVAIEVPTPTLEGGVVLEMDSIDLSVVASQVTIVIGEADVTDKFIDGVWQPS